MADVSNIRGILLGIIKGKSYMENQTTTKNLSYNQTNYLDKAEPRILLFDLNHLGHHPGYIQHLVEYWKAKKLSGSLDILVTPSFVQLHTEIVAIAETSELKNINFITISPEEEASISSKSTALKRAFHAFNEWKILCKYASKLETTECLIMYFDSIQFPLFLGLKPPCSLSGIYFRPLFHYSDFIDFTPSLRERFWQWRDKLFLSKILKQQCFKSLFCLDRFVVDPIKAINNSVNTVSLSDPVQVYDDYQVKTEELKREWSIESERTVFLMFGVYRPRKGIEELLSAIELLPTKLAEKVCLLLVGPIGAESIVKNHVQTIQQKLPVQVVSHTDFIADREIQPYFKVSDVILAPYQRHIGMSAILVRAASAQKPVLSSNYGLMGELVRRYQLGIAVDTEIPTEIAKGLSQFIKRSPQGCGDINKMKDFARQNTAEKFAATIFNNINL